METSGAAWVFSFPREEADMNLDKGGLESPAAVGCAIGSLSDPESAAKDARSAGTATTQATARIRPVDLDLLRLSYVCRANTLLRDLPERSLVLSRIHGFFDASPDRASVERFSLCALIDGEPAGSSRPTSERLHVAQPEADLARGASAALDSAIREA
jgi:hypothetical protein